MKFHALPPVWRGSLAGLLLVAVATVGCQMLGYATGRSAKLVEVQQRLEGSLALGVARFVFDDFGGLDTLTLETNALPWKVSTTALVLEEARSRAASVEPRTLRAVLTRFGFVFPSAVENWDDRLPLPVFDKPLGIVSGIVTRRLPVIELEVANLGCAVCHAGVLYSRDGEPTTRVWLGLPNTSVNLEAYTRAVYQSLRAAAMSQETLLDAIPRLYPDVGSREMLTIRRYVWPRMVKRLSELASTINAPTPFSNGGPGLTNGVGSLKFQLGLLAPHTMHAEHGYTSIPDLGDVLLRTSLLYDGLYAPSGRPRFSRLTRSEVSATHLRELAAITAFFTVPTMGMRPDRAHQAIASIEEVFEFVKTYHAPRFPGPIDEHLASQGQVIYGARCANCHGEYSGGLTNPSLVSFPNRLCQQEEMNTDPERWKTIDTHLLHAIERTRFEKDVNAERTGGYVAPRLSGLWATAPYLHNGSVPTLWHLMNPAERPVRFYLGGHRLDFERVGIAGDVDATGTYQFPAGYHPWAESELYDTTTPGRSNAGHVREFENLSAGDKRALLEYLKLL